MDMYVFSVYSITVLVVAVMCIAPLVSHMQIKNRVKQGVGRDGT